MVFLHRESISFCNISVKSVTISENLLVEDFYIEIKLSLPFLSPNLDENISDERCSYAL